MQLGASRSMSDSALSSFAFEGGSVTGNPEVEVSKGPDCGANYDRRFKPNDAADDRIFTADVWYTGFITRYQGLRMARKKVVTAHTFELGEIVETLFIEGDMEEAMFDHLLNFSIDVKGRTRLGRGMVNMDPANEDDINYVPSQRFNIKANPWNSHQQYVEIELPNPALDFAYYQQIRAAFLQEMSKRVPSLVQALPPAVTAIIDGP
jgi:hypothetical protein